MNDVYYLLMVHASAQTPRERRHDENLRRLVDIAMRLIEEGGLAALSMNRLAEAMNYTPGALYRYFASKDALLSQLVARVLEDIRAHMDRALALLPRRAAPLCRVLILALAYGTFARQEPRRFGLLAQAIAEPRVLLPESVDAAPVVVAAIAALTPLAEALSAAAQAGQLGKGAAPERTVCVFALLQGLLQLHKQTRYAADVLDLQRLTLQGTRALLIGWGASARAVDSAITTVTALGERSQRLGGGLPMDATEPVVEEVPAPRRARSGRGSKGDRS